MEVTRDGAHLRADNPQPNERVVFSYVGSVNSLKNRLARLVYLQVNILYEWVNSIVLRQLNYKQFHRIEFTAEVEEIRYNRLVVTNC